MSLTDASPVPSAPHAQAAAWRLDADASHERLTVTLHAAAGTHDFIAAMHAAARAAATRPPLAVVVDLLALERAPSLDEARRLGDAVGRLGRPVAGPIALLASRVVVYGAARMIAAFAEVHGALVGVFRAPADADAWMARELERSGRTA